MEKHNSGSVADLDDIRPLRPRFLVCNPQSMNAYDDNRLLLLGRTNWRNQRRLFGIRQRDRLAHMYIIGKTGTGKSTLLASMAAQDLEAGQGFALLDPHGDLVERLLPLIPEERRDDVLYFDVPDASRPLGFNPLAGVPPGSRPLAASGMLDAMKKIWADSWGPRLEHLLRNALLALLEQPAPSLADILRLLSDERFRRSVAARVSNLQVREFWLREYEGYPRGFRAEAIAPVQNKVGAFLAHPVLRAILTQPTSAFDPRRLMDEGKVMLVNLAKGRLGEDASALLGSLLISRFGLAALSRVNSPEGQRRDYFLYLDEFHTFTTLSLANMLSELRKYHVGLVLAHQYLGQLEEEVRDAVLGNVGTMICFRVGSEDADVMSEAAPQASLKDLLSLPNYHAYLQLMVSGNVSRPFTAEIKLPRTSDPDLLIHTPAPSQGYLTRGTM